MDLARRAASTPQFRRLSKRIIDSTMQSVRLQVPPSVIKSMGPDVLKKLKG
jgi:hypothetical protein